MGSTPPGTITAQKENSMKNGMKAFAPETAIGTGAAEPLVDEYEAAKETPSVDESTVGNGAQNQPGKAASIEYSGEATAEPTTGDDETSTGEDFETRHESDDSLAGAAVVPNDPDVNKKVEEVRPDVPQATKTSRARTKKA